MTTIVPVGFGEVIHSFTLAGDAERMAVTYGIGLFGEGTVDLAAVAGELHDAWGDTFMSRMANSYILKQTEVRFQFELNAEVTIAVHAADRVGASANAPLPQNCAFLCHKRTARPGRRGRGRFYLPGVPEGSVDGAGNIVSGEAPLWQTQATAFLQRFTAPGPLAAMKMALLHQTQPGATWEVGDPVPEGLAPDFITALTIDLVIATQRRRLR